MILVLLALEIALIKIFLYFVIIYFALVLLHICMIVIFYKVRGVRYPTGCRVPDAASGTRHPVGYPPAGRVRNNDISVISIRNSINQNIFIFYNNIFCPSIITYMHDSNIL